MSDRIRVWIYIVIGIALIGNFWLNFNNAHNVSMLQENQVTDSLNRSNNINVTIKHIYPNDTSFISKSE